MKIDWFAVCLIIGALVIYAPFVGWFVQVTFR